MKTIYLVNVTHSRNYDFSYDVYPCSTLEKAIEVSKEQINKAFDNNKDDNTESIFGKYDEELFHVKRVITNGYVEKYNVEDKFTGNQYSVKIIETELLE